MPIVQYNAEDNPTLNEFHLDNTFIRAIMGPVGSGKSVACSMEVLRRAIEQEPNALNVRKTKFACVRNTYRELIDTTMSTFKEWVPPELGTWKVAEHQFNMKFTLPDNTIVESEVLFRALDTPKDLRKLLSLELTGCWFNEAREVLWGVVDLMQTRVGRYPKLKFPDVGPTWNGIWLDTNPPDTDSKFYKIFEEVRPPGYRLFRQPSGLAANAENIHNLIPGYYSRLVAGKSDDWIQIYVNGEYGFVSDGKPIFPEYKDGVHCVNLSDYKPDLSLPVYIGIDFGLTPAAVFGQLTRSGKWIIFDELVTEDMGAARFSHLLNKKINGKYPGYDYKIYGDPAGDQRAPTDETTPYQILAKHNIMAIPAPTNDPVVRFEAVRGALTRMDMDATPGFLILPECNMLRKSLRGGYVYRRIQVSGERYQDKPDKNSIYSHVNDALQYLLCGAGEGHKVVRDSSAYDHISYDELDRMIV